MANRQPTRSLPILAFLAGVVTAGVLFSAQQKRKRGTSLGQKKSLPATEPTRLRVTPSHRDPQPPAGLPLRPVLAAAVLESASPAYLPSSKQVPAAKPAPEDPRAETRSPQPDGFPASEPESPSGTVDEEPQQGGPVEESASPRFPLQTLLAIVVFVGTLLLVQHYGISDKGVTVDQLTQMGGSLVDFDSKHTVQLPIVAVEVPAPPKPLPQIVTQPVLNNEPTPEPSKLLLDRLGMDHFYSALVELGLHRRTTPVHVVHYGDSPTTADLITGDNREELQKLFGNAGHGYILIDRPWAWYNHRGVTLTASGWKIETAVGAAREGDFGLGGASFQGSVGASAKFRLADTTQTDADVYFQSRPGGGNFQVSADGTILKTIDTNAEARQSSFAKIELPAGTASVQIRPVSGSVELYGIAFGKDTPGITYDSLGLNGASTIVVSRVFRKEHWTGQLQHRQPDLVILNYGTNESGFLNWIDRQYETELRTAIQRIREAVPQSSILIMSPMDRGERSGGSIHTMSGIRHIIAIQARVAQETGCGFFNTFEAMGGESTMQRWYDGQPRLVAADLIHPSPRGAKIVSDAFVRELVLGLQRYKQLQSGSGLHAAPSGTAGSTEADN